MKFWNFATIAIIWIACVTLSLAGITTGGLSLIAAIVCTVVVLDHDGGDRVDTDDDCYEARFDVDCNNSSYGPLVPDIDDVCHGHIHFATEESSNNVTMYQANKEDSDMEYWDLYDTDLTPVKSNFKSKSIMD